MWFKIDDKHSEIFISDELIEFNPNLSADLCAEMIMSKKGLEYFDLLTIFQQKSYESLLHDFRSDEPGFIFSCSSESIVASLRQLSGRKNRTKTFFTLRNNTLYVTKRAENNENRIGIVNERVLVGEYLIPTLIKHMNGGSRLRFELLLIEFINFVFEEFEMDEKRLKPEAIDCIPKNTIITEKGFEFFDMEYRPSMEFLKTHFVFRCVMSLDRKVFSKDCWPYKSPYELYSIILNYMGIDPNVDIDVQSEISFLETVLDGDSLFLDELRVKNIFYNRRDMAFKRVIKLIIRKISGWKSQ